MATTTQYYGTGRRKTSTARVYLKPGKGNFVINDRTLEEYFGRQTSRVLVCVPFVVTGLENKFDVHVSVNGGGINGQAGAIKHGVSRALAKYAIEVGDDAIRHSLRKSGNLTRDDRETERKKVGRPGARKKKQFSKR